VLKRYASESILEVRVSNIGQDTSSSQFFVDSLQSKQTPSCEFNPLALEMDI